MATVTVSDTTETAGRVTIKGVALEFGEVNKRGHPPTVLEQGSSHTPNSSMSFTFEFGEVNKQGPSSDCPRAGEQSHTKQQYVLYF
ncbi:hypothetical protein STEG23_000673 [Scotinomys teguina]